MKKIISILSITALILFVGIVSGCESDSSGRKFGGRTWSESLSPNDAALERAIIADVMGGIAASVIVPEEMALAGIARLDEENAYNKISINVPLTRAFTGVADSFEYPSENQMGSLTISVDGDVEELNSYSDTKKELRFFPLEVKFNFIDYDYVNSCGLHAVITGNIYCRLQGSVNRLTDVFEGKGSCSSGTKGMTGTLLYEMSENESHDVFFQASVWAEGPWYELTSYQFYGNYMLDRRSGTIDSIIARPAEMCEW